MKPDLPGEDSDSDQDALDRLRRDSRGTSADAGRVRSFLQDQAERLWAASLLEKGVLLGGLALGAVGLVLVVGTLFGGSSSDGPEVLLAAESFTTEQRAATTAPTETPVATPQTDPTASVVASTLPTAVANRESCQAIRGTAYLSALERSWYVANCGETDVSPQSGPVAPPTSEPTTPPVAPPTSKPPEVPSTPVEQDSFSAADAIASGASWISTQAEAGYEVDGASCTASDLGYTWLVSCRVHMSGCERAICEAWLSACVTEPDGAILPSKLC